VTRDEAKASLEASTTNELEAIACGVLGFRLACGVAVAIVGVAVIVRSIALDAAERALPAEEDGE